MTNGRSEDQPQNPNVVTEFIEWRKIGEVKVVRGKIHQYLGMKLDYSQDGKLLDMVDYITKIVDDFFMEKIPQKTITPWTDKLFTVTPGNSLDKEMSELFHTTTAQGLFACKSKNRHCTSNCLPHDKR
jgi:hypothetical protein